MIEEVERAFQGRGFQLGLLCAFQLPDWKVLHKVTQLKSRQWVLL